MKRILLVLPLIMTLFSACTMPLAATPPAEMEITAVPSNTEVILMPTDEVPGMKLPAPSFESQTYIDEKYGFAFDYPLGWTVSEPMFSERATQVQFLSSPE